MAQDWWTGEGDPTTTVENDIHNLNIVPPKPVPAPSFITLKINIGCTSIVRQWDEPFRPTITYTAPFLYETNLNDYLDLIPVVANAIWQYVGSEQNNGARVETHIGVWLDNVTHPDVAAGVVPLAKGNWDIQLSNEEFTSAQILEDRLTGTILNVRNVAKY